MSSDSGAPIVPAFGLRLGLWYATLFVAGAIAIVFVTYSLTASSLAQRDRQIVQQKLSEYAAAYAEARKHAKGRHPQWTDVALAYDAGLRHALSLPLHQQRHTMRLLRVLLAANREVKTI